MYSMTDTAMIAELFKAVGTPKAELLAENERLKREISRMQIEMIRLRRREEAKEREMEKVWR